MLRKESDCDYSIALFVMSLRFVKRKGDTLYGRVRNIYYKEHAINAMPNKLTQNINRNSKGIFFIPIMKTWTREMLASKDDVSSALV